MGAVATGWIDTGWIAKGYRTGAIAPPKETRKAMHLHPGQEFELITSGPAIQLIPKLSGEELKAAITAGVASGKGRPADEAFGRLESKYSKQAGK